MEIFIKQNDVKMLLKGGGKMSEVAECVCTDVAECVCTDLAECVCVD